MTQEISSDIKSTSIEETKVEDLLEDKIIVENLLDDLDFDTFSSSEDENDNKNSSSEKPNFSGVWTLKSHTNTDEFLLGMGIPWAMRKFAPLATVTETIKHDVKNDSFTRLVSINVPFLQDTKMNFKMNNKPIKNKNPMGEIEYSKSKWINNNKTIFIQVTNQNDKQKNFNEKIYLENNNTMIQFWTNVKGTNTTRTFIRQEVNE